MCVRLSCLVGRRLSIEFKKKGILMGFLLNCNAEVLIFLLVMVS